MNNVEKKRTEEAVIKDKSYKSIACTVYCSVLTHYLKIKIAITFLSKKKKIMQFCPIKTSDKDFF